MNLEVKSQSTKEVELSSKKVDFQTLKGLCSAAQQKLSPIASYEEIHSFIRREFFIDCTLDDVIRVYSLEICEIENEILYKQYGF
jgi:hypothetical protein